VSPILLANFEGKKFIAGESFNRCLDIYFAHLATRNDVEVDERE
jgi:hypothetical protein